MFVNTIAAMSLGAGMLIAAANSPARVPAFDVTPSCRAAAVALSSNGRDMKGCLNSENSARKSLVEQWGQFAAADRSMCSTLSMTGGSPTYTELLTCLEMARDGRKIERNDPAARGVAEDHSLRRPVAR
jgi:hypothetical protein